MNEPEQRKWLYKLRTLPVERLEPPDDSTRLLLQRLQRSLRHLVDMAPRPALADALEAPTDFDALARLLDSLVQEHPELDLLDRELRSDLKLLEARRSLVNRAGGTWTTSIAADHLGITPEAVRKRVQRGRLLAYKSPSGEHRLPCAQFTKAGTLEGLNDVLEAMHVEDAWMRVQLFLDDDVLGALREGRVEDAVRTVASYLPDDAHSG